MTRDEALELLKQHLHQPNLIKHCLAVEQCMKALARKLGGDEETWGLAGLLHDLDYEVTEKSPELHTREAVKVLAQYNFPAEILQAIQAHAGQVPCQSAMDWSIYTADPTTGLIIAAALMHPAKKLKAVDLDFLKRRFKEKGFARGAKREEIAKCVNLGLTLDEFLGICLQAMQAIDEELGLA
ncbi:MAG: HDIG domain-containing protein [Acidobacteriota bacterium]|nr:HDIG domain-containing protein [Acidobacteriota bacterium]